MHLPWIDDRCIICALAPAQRSQRSDTTAKFTKEHVIPEAIGGKLTCAFLCKHCNDRLGLREARLKNDSRIRWAIQNLQQRLPSLWKTMSQGQSYAVLSPSGNLAAHLKNGEVSIDASRRQDGSFVYPLQNLAQELRIVDWQKAMSRTRSKRLLRHPLERGYRSLRSFRSQSLNRSPCFPS